MVGWSAQGPPTSTACGSSTVPIDAITPASAVITASATRRSAAVRSVEHRPQAVDVERGAPRSAQAELGEDLDQPDGPAVGADGADVRDLAGQTAAPVQHLTRGDHGAAEAGPEEQVDEVVQTLRGTLGPLGQGGPVDVVVHHRTPAQQGSEQRDGVEGVDQERGVGQPDEGARGPVHRSGHAQGAGQDATRCVGHHLGHGVDQERLELGPGGGHAAPAGGLVAGSHPAGRAARPAPRPGRPRPRRRRRGRLAAGRRCRPDRGAPPGGRPPPATRPRSAGGPTPRWSVWRWRCAGPARPGSARGCPAAGRRRAGRSARGPRRGWAVADLPSGRSRRTSEGRGRSC